MLLCNFLTVWVLFFPHRIVDPSEKRCVTPSDTHLGPERQPRASEPTWQEQQDRPVSQLVTSTLWYLLS